MVWATLPPTGHVCASLPARCRPPRPGPRTNPAPRVGGGRQLAGVRGAWTRWPVDQTCVVRGGQARAGPDTRGARRPFRPRSRGRGPRPATIGRSSRSALRHPASARLGSASAVRVFYCFAGARLLFLATVASRDSVALQLPTYTQCSFWHHHPHLKHYRTTNSIAVMKK